jgi:hypothetical protein
MFTLMTDSIDFNFNTLPSSIDEYDKYESHTLHTSHTSHTQLHLFVDSVNVMFSQIIVGHALCCVIKKNNV